MWPYLAFHGNASTGWRTGRKVEEKGWYKSLCSPVTMRAPQTGVSLLYPAPYTCTKHSHLILSLPTITKHALFKNHTESPHTTFMTFFPFLFLKELQIWTHLWASQTFHLPALLRMISFALKAGHHDMVAEAGVELKEEQSSWNERQKPAEQKICQEKTLETTS